MCRKFIAQHTKTREKQKVCLFSNYRTFGPFNSSSIEVQTETVLSAIWQLDLLK